MKVLITGASGFLGQYALRALRQRQIDVVALGRQRPQGSDDVRFIQADLLGDDKLAAAVAASEASHLLHLAWYAEHGKYWTAPVNLRWVDATVKLVEAFCQVGGRQVVVAGTCAEYAWTNEVCREDITPLEPATLYGTAKDGTRRLAMAVCVGHRVPCAWGRVFLPFGAGENSRRLVPSLISALRGQYPPFAVNGAAYRDFLHAADVADGFLALLGSDMTGTYNICSGQPVQIAELVRCLARLLEADPEPILRLAAERPGEPHCLAGENQRLKALGWRQNYSLEAGLKRTLDDLSGRCRDPVRGAIHGV